MRLMYRMNLFWVDVSIGVNVEKFERGVNRLWDIKTYLSEGIIGFNEFGFESGDLPYFLDWTSNSSEGVESPIWCLI